MRGGARGLAFAAIGSMAVLLAGCEEGGWFGSPEKPLLPGTRIAILDFDAGLAPDPELAGVRPALPPPSAGPWPQPYGDSAHDAGHRALAERPSLAWSISIGEGENNEERRIVYPPVASETSVFTLDAGGNVAAWSLDGSSRWRMNPAPEEEQDGFGGGLAYADGTVYYAAGFAALVALDADTGAERWRVRLPTPSHAAPSVNGGRIVVVTIDNRVIALDARDGSTTWVFDAPPATAALLGGATPAVAAGGVVAAMTTGEVVAFRAANGRVTWDDALTAVRRVGVAEAIPAVRASPVISGGKVIAVGAAGFTAGIDFATGARVWDRTIGGAQTPAVAGGFAFVATDRGDLAALSAEDGRVAWSVDMRAAEGPDGVRDADPYSYIFAGPVAAGGNLVVVRGDGRLLFFSPADGSLSHAVSVPGRTTLPPIVANRTLYVLTEAGVLAAYR